MRTRYFDLYGNPITKAQWDELKRTNHANQYPYHMVSNGPSRSCWGAVQWIGFDTKKSGPGRVYSAWFRCDRFIGSTEHSTFEDAQAWLHYTVNRVVGEEVPEGWHMQITRKGILWGIPPQPSITVNITSAATAQMQVSFTEAQRTVSALADAFRRIVP